MELIKSIPISIRFYLQGYPKVEKTNYNVYVQLIYKRKKTIFPVKMTSTAEDWDFENGQYRAIKQFNLVRNNKLRDIKEYISNLYLDAKRSGLPVSLTQIKLSFTGKVVVTKELLFVDYFQNYIKELREKPNEYTIGAVSNYEKTQVHLLRFLKLNGWLQIKLTEFNKKVMERFEHYLLTYKNAITKRSMTGNTANNYMRKVRAALNAAVRKDIMQTSPIQGFKLISNKQVNKTFLTVEELELLKNHDMGGNQSLQTIKDIFLFSCYTGLRFSDIDQLNESMVSYDANGMIWISLVQKKTGEIIDIPLLDHAAEIYSKYSKYRKSHNGRVLPRISNQKINTSIKIIAIFAGINRKFSFHSARHTFATVGLELGLDIKTVSSLLGHSSVKSTEVYAKVTRKRKADAIKFLNSVNTPTSELQ